MVPDTHKWLMKSSMVHLMWISIAMQVERCEKPSSYTLNKESLFHIDHSLAKYGYHWVLLLFAFGIQEHNGMYKLAWVSFSLSMDMSNDTEENFTTWKYCLQINLHLVGNSLPPDSHNHLKNQVPLDKNVIYKYIFPSNNIYLSTETIRPINQICFLKSIIVGCCVSSPPNLVTKLLTLSLPKIPCDGMLHTSPVTTKMLSNPVLLV